MYVPEAADLPIGAPVRVDGIDVGTVKAKNLVGKYANAGRAIELILRVEKRDQDMIRTDSVAALAAEGLWGKRFVDVERGFNGTALNDGGEIAASPSRVLTVDQAINSMAKFGDCMKEAKDSANAPISTVPMPNR